MAKGQVRKNREARKPKAEKPAAVAAPSSISNIGMLAAINNPKKKR